MRQSLYEFCVENKRTELLSEWDDCANMPLTPKTVSYGSKQKAHWRCESGHEWEAQVCSRSGGSGCPVCAGKTVLTGENDLATLFPALAEEWNSERNGGLTPDAVGAFTHRKVWWRCSDCGFEWEAEIKSRAGSKRSGCPACANRMLVPGQNDLTTEHPELAFWWHPTKNGRLTPRDVTSGTSRKVWWRCELGHEWEAAVAGRVRGSGCPVCAGKTVLKGFNDLASRYPILAKEWHPTKNGATTPENVTALSNKSAWWICGRGHEYKAAVSARVSDSSGCPYCANQKVLKGFNDLATLLPKVAAEWHPSLNGSLTAGDVTCGSAKKVWWKCGTCGHEWKAVVFSRAGSMRTGCPACAGAARNKTSAQYQLRAPKNVPPPASKPRPRRSQSEMELPRTE